MKIEQALNIDIARKIKVGKEEMTLYEAARWIRCYNSES